jgi:oligoribonuclease NrnB/cAMP/cGMP phosphodiesterase (DHH superfamily)
MNTYILYHANCNDGMGAAVAAYKKFGTTATYVPVQYSEPFPESVVLDIDTELYILDFSYSRDIIVGLKQIVGNLVVIDHHKTAQEALDGLDYAIFDMEQSGAVLAWKYFHPDEVVPRAFEYIQDRDLWKFHLGQTEHFSAGIRSIDGYKDFEYWLKMINSIKLTDNVILRGQVLSENDKKMVESKVKKPDFAKTVYINGYKVAVFNTTNLISELGSAFCSDERFDYDLSMSYFFLGNGNMVLSFRSATKQVDVSQLAKMLGGGGHSSAAGAVIPQESVGGFLNQLYSGPETPRITLNKKTEPETYKGINIAKIKDFIKRIVKM